MRKLLIISSILVLHCFIIGCSAVSEDQNNASLDVLELRIRHSPSKAPAFEYLINGQSFTDYADLKEHLLKLPKKHVVEYHKSCSRFAFDQPFSSNEQIDDFKSFCQNNNIALIWHYSG